MGSLISENILKIGVERNLIKLFNRYSIIEKKKYSEDNLYEFSQNLNFFSKKLRENDKIINEEFLSKGTSKKKLLQVKEKCFCKRLNYVFIFFTKKN